MRIVAILTDFGEKDPYVAIMKGIILKENRNVTFVDITHKVAPFDIMEGALFLKVTKDHFPSGTIFLVVVDPSVGSERRAIVVKSEGKFFVGPDNGIFTPLFMQEFDAYEIPIPPGASPTFHGRDVFAKVVAKLSMGFDPEGSYRRIRNPERINWPSPQMVGDSLIEGEIIHIDGFGNLITNIEGKFVKRGARIKIKGKEIQGLKRAYYEAKKGEVLALVDSFGLLEISIREGNAKDFLKVQKGEKVKVFLK